MLTLQSFYFHQEPENFIFKDLPIKKNDAGGKFTPELALPLAHPARAYVE